jgi:hypothetical protein
MALFVLCEVTSLGRGVVAALNIADERPATAAAAAAAAAAVRGATGTDSHR